jgi:hypothetical protein
MNLNVNLCTKNASNITYNYVYTMAKFPNLGDCWDSLFFNCTDLWNAYSTLPDTAIINVLSIILPHVSVIVGCFDHFCLLKLLIIIFKKHTVYAGASSCRFFTVCVLYRENFLRIHIFSDVSLAPTNFSGFESSGFIIYICKRRRIVASGVLLNFVYTLECMTIWKLYKTINIIM